MNADLRDRACRPLVVCLPSDDGSFRAATTTVLAAHADISPFELEMTLRIVYPRAIVRRRDLSAEPVETWYAYRDGSFAPPSHENWADSPGVAWARFDPQTGQILAANDELAALFRPADGRMVGHFAREFIPPGADAISAAQLQAIGGTPETRSVGLARRGDGEAFVVEFVARPIDDAIEAWYRAVAVAGSLTR
jgi:hypothetical protein